MPELRIDPICGRRVYIAEERLGRPNDFVTVETGHATLVDAQAAREGCPFCAGHESATPHSSAEVRDAKGQWQVRVVPNKFPAVAFATDVSPAACGLAQDSGDAPAKPQAAVGAHEVVIESPTHVTEILDLTSDQLATVLGVYRDRLAYWTSDARLRHGIVFKNSGCTAGASLEHIHSQLIALPYISPYVEAELAGAQQFGAAHGGCIFCKLLAQEIAAGERLVFEDAGYAALCPYAARQPFETWILPTRHAARFDQTPDADLPGLAAAIRGVLLRLATVCRSAGRELAYNLALHTGPFDAGAADSYHWHWELIPRTTHLAGLEWGAGVYINPVSPERAARELRDAASP
jgi:UDPglucose--hexose-1-phosphate uridylyltransferase